MTHVVANTVISKDKNIPLILFMALLVFFCHLILTNLFASKLVYLQWDVLFGSDTQTYIGSFSHGWGGRGVRHPNVSNMINPPVRLIAYVIDLVGLTKDSQESVRYNLSLVIVPIASAVKIIIFGLILTMLGANKTQLAIGLIIAAMSFSQVIFGTIPESFGISEIGRAHV